MTNSPEDPFTQVPDGSQPPPRPETPQAPPSQPGYTAAPQYGQQQYAQQQYAYPAAGPNPATAKNWMGITALVLSLASIITGITAIGGIIFGHMSIAAAKRGEADNGGMGRAGMIIGYIFVVLGILLTIGMFWLFGVFVAECSGVDRPVWC